MVPDRGPAQYEGLAGPFALVGLQRLLFQGCQMSVAVELFDACQGLRDLSFGARKALADVGYEVTFKRDERIVSMLEPPSRILVVLEGIAKLVGISPRGIQRILYVFRPSDIIGSRLLLDDSVETPYPVIAMVPVRAVAISKASLMAVAVDHPECVLFLAEKFSRRLASAMNTLLLATSAEIPVRLCQLLLEFAEGGKVAPSRESPEGFVPLTHHLTHEMMAQIVGASRPHTSTALRDLEVLGAVLRQSDRGLLVRPAGLTRIASQQAAG